MNDKEQIEKGTVDAFVALHNQAYGTNYSVKEYGDHGGNRPDAFCATSDGEQFYVEVTITEDRPGDIPWVLGKVSQRPYKGRPGSCLQGNVLAQLTTRLGKKALMRYGGQTALVIRVSSGVDWDWNYVKNEVQDYLQGVSNPYQMGVWIVNRTKTRLHKLA